ncbi:uncharacterized protein LOC131007023 isoform X2 [Salvia miltiorrhiza]|uniref:uncharacterized protein LOC131007023 isoform X2 n=1 Tax=Salvia miltiorrhiza TaxID=226208 RepID=UPI0025AC7B36|nr:uncharacterized protein LOC131007023 isoform X2 [Salvia miltiorrhiza]
MAIMDLLRNNPNFGGQTFNSRGLFPAKLGGSSAAYAFAFGALLGNGVTQYAYCDAGATFGEDYLSKIRTASGKIFQNEALTYKPHLCMEEEDDDFLGDDMEENKIDLVIPFKKSVRQIMLETTIVTTRRVLERFVVYYGSQRMAWKVLKDVPNSALRKAGRGMPTFTYIYRVSRTTFRGHFLGVLASWIVHVGIDIYQFLSSVSKAKKAIDTDTLDTRKQVRILRRKVSGATVGCCASLVFASVGAGIGASLTRPSVGQWIGSGIGDVAGPIIIAFCFEKARGGL